MKMGRLGGKFLIAFFPQFIALSLANQNLVPIFISEMGSFLGTEAFEEVEEKSAFDCVMRCVKTSGCRTIDYKRRGNDCFLNSKSRREVGLINSDDYIHYDVVYHTQKSEKADFGPVDIDMPTVPPIVRAPLQISTTSGPCDSSPCQNGGTCIETANTFSCTCTESFTGDGCENLKSSSVKPAPPSDHDFELVYRNANITNYARQILLDVWVTKLTVCSWVHTPKIGTSQQMAIWSLRTEKNGSKDSLTALIDGNRGFYLSWDTQWIGDPNFFSTSPKDDWVFLCVIVKKNNNENKVEAIINANYSNKVSSTNVPASFKSVKLRALFLGQKLHKNINWNFVEGYSFKGRLADVNIWDWDLQEDHVGKWYRGTGRDERPRVAWNRLGYPSKRFGDVHLVTITSAFFGRAWRKVQNFDELVINKTSNVEVEKAEQKDENGNVVSLKVQISITMVTECSDENTAPVDAVFIMVPGNWRRIKFKQVFTKTQRCYALFGSVPSWAPPTLTNPGVHEFDPNQDEIWQDSYVGDLYVDQFREAISLCGEDHFWTGNQDGQEKARANLRRKTGATTAGISTYGKCGRFDFVIKEIEVLETQ